MAIPYEEILASYTPEQRERIAAGAARFRRAEEERREIREILARAQSEAAGTLAAEPAEADRLRAEAERYLIALRKAVRKLGGRLDLVVDFPEKAPARVVRLSELEVWPDRKRPRRRKADDSKKA